jgi:hypothetical protein
MLSQCRDRTIRTKNKTTQGTIQWLEKIENNKQKVPWVVGMVFGS